MCVDRDEAHMFARRGHAWKKRGKGIVSERRCENRVPCNLIRRLSEEIKITLCKGELRRYPILFVSGGIYGQG